MAYVIGSQKGKDIAKDLKTNETYEASDGSVWTKKADGSVSVKTSSGETYDNAYKPTSNGTSGTTNKTYTPTGTHNDSTLPAWATTQINGYKQQYNDAIARGDREAAQIAHQAAEAIRQSFNYSGGIDGSEYIDLGYTVPDFEYTEARPTAPQSDPRINELLSQILNREDFSYDVANDPLYQQYRQMYQREGDRAMRDTLAEVATGAGGMNSYAVTAAQQANNYYNSQLNDKIPELYQLAYQMYLQDKESMVQDLGLLQDMDATQYSRYRDTMNDWYNDRNFAYGMYRDDVGDAQRNKSFDYNSMRDSLNFSNDNYLANKEFDANREDTEYNRTQAEKESAKEEIAWYIENGVSFENISPDLIAKSGLSENAIRQMITNEQLKKASKGSSKNGNNNDDLKPIEPEAKIYTDGNSGMNSIGLGIGPISDETLLKLVEGGAVILNADGTMQWADGYSPSNYQSVLESYKPWQMLPGLTF